jgi:hypothetical protein
MLSYGEFYDVNLIRLIESFPDEKPHANRGLGKYKAKKVLFAESVEARITIGWQNHCKSCKTRNTLQSRTVMQASKLLFVSGFWRFTC